MDWVEMSMTFEPKGVLVKLQTLGSSVTDSINSHGDDLYTTLLFSVMKDSHQFMDRMLWNMSINVVSIP